MCLSFVLVVNVFLNAKIQKCDFKIKSVTKTLQTVTGQSNAINFTEQIKGINIGHS